MLSITSHSSRPLILRTLSLIGGRKEFEAVIKRVILMLLSLHPSLFVASCMCLLAVLQDFEGGHGSSAATVHNRTAPNKEHATKTTTTRYELRILTDMWGHRSEGRVKLVHWPSCTVTCVLL